LSTENKIKLTKPYFENLDALRFFAAFSVFIFHIVQELKVFLPISEDQALYKGLTFFTSKGTLGVNFFFVLSGFLITYLILYEHQTKGQFNLKNFLIRRTLRIWPLYFLIILIGFVLFPLVFAQYSTNHSPLMYSLFLANFDELSVGLHDNINFLTAPWSVAVEEQFYLFWGIILFFVSRFKKFKLSYLLFILFAGSILFSYINFDQPRILYYHTLSVMSNIIIGAGLALAYFKQVKWLMQLKEMSKFKIILIYLIGIILILLKNKIFVGHFAIFQHTILSLYFAFIIFDQIYLTRSFFKFGRIRLFNHLGQISYGLYLYHLVILYLLIKVVNLVFTLIDRTDVNYSLVTFFFIVFGAGLTYLLSRWSYRFFERPFLTLKRKFN